MDADIGLLNAIYYFKLEGLDMPPLLIPCLFLLAFWTYCNLILPLRARKLLRDAPFEQSSASKFDLYKRGALFTGFFTLAALSAGLISRITIFGSIGISPITLLLSAALIGLNICAEPLEWRFTSTDNKQRLLKLAPQTNRERAVWILIVLVPAVGEEIIYRAVFFGLFHELVGSFWIAVLISSILFAVAHKSYGLQAVVSSFLIGLVLQFFVGISGGLFVSITVHYVLDVINGMRMGSRQSGILFSDRQLARNEGATRTEVTGG